MARAADAPVAPFGATRAGVLGLVPEARLVPGDVLVEGRYGVTEAQVDRWLDELSGDVSVRLDGWERLSDTPVVDESGEEPVELIAGDRTRLRAWAAGVVHNGAASYLEDARHPERAGVNDTAYGAVLWARYEAGLDKLAAWLEVRLASPDAGDTEEPVAELAGIVHSFPAPLVGDRLRF
jgi:hypothetical protein